MDMQPPAPSAMPLQHLRWRASWLAPCLALLLAAGCASTPGGMPAAAPEHAAALAQLDQGQPREAAQRLEALASGARGNTRLALLADAAFAWHEAGDDVRARSLTAQVDARRVSGAARARLAQVNTMLRTQAHSRGVPVIGSTVVVLLALGIEVACLWAGDSRIYLYRHGRLQQLTRDHSQLEALKARGADIAACAASPNMITRAVGAADTIDVDVANLSARDGDIFLLCSDGLSTPVEDEAIAAALASGDCAQAAQDLVGLALANGGRDNITVVVVRVDDLAGDKTVINPAL